jgi:hypothetical protein
MADWYARGLLARDFASKIDDDVEADFLNGRFGIIIDGTNVPHGSIGRNWKLLNPDDDLVAIPLSRKDGGRMTITSGNDYGGCMMISARTRDPAAIMRMFNLTTAVFAEGDKPAFVVDDAYRSGANSGWATFWCALAMGEGYVEDKSLEKQAGYLAFQALNRGSDGSELSNARMFSALNVFNNINSWINEGTAADGWVENWAHWSMWFGAESWPHSLQMREENRFFSSPRKGQETEAESEENQNLHAKHIEFATLAIMNNTAEQSFNEWVEYFNNNGGHAIIEQVNEQYRNR